MPNTEREQWNDAAFATRWAQKNTANPAREQALELLVTVMRDYVAATPVPLRVLDVGCGHGEIAARVLDALPQVSLVGVDGSPPMLDLARERLTPYGARATLAQADFETLTAADLQGGPFGVAFASQSIHNCSDEGKRQTFASVRAVMALDGLFLLYDRIKLVTPALFPVYQSVWASAPDLMGSQVDEGDSFAAHTASVTQRGDKPGSLEQNMLWLREAGFAEVAAVQVIGIRALIAAVAR